MFGFFLRGLLESCLKLSTIAMISLYYEPLEKNKDNINCIFSLLLIASIIVFSLIALALMIRRYELLTNEEYDSKYGSLYEGLNTSNKVALMLNFFHIWRRLVLGFTIVFL